jgi:hypothetical protein
MRCFVFVANYGKSSAGQFANESCHVWKRIGGKLKKHELTPEHIKNVNTWLEALRRLSRNDEIDNMVLELIKKEMLI